MTEFALVLPVICLLLFGVIQFGIVFHDYITLTDATRAGGRRAAVSADLSASQRQSVIQSAVRNSAKNLDQSKLQIPSAVSSWTQGADVTVSASYPYSVSLLGFVVKAGTLSSTVTERVE